MPLTVNGLVVNDGDPLLVEGVQAGFVTVNGVQVWQNTQMPSAIADFVASDTEIGQITCTWSPATGVPPEMTYNLMNADTNALLVSAVVSPYVYLFSGIVNLRVDAVNTTGTTPSNADSGTGIVPSGSQEFTAAGTFTVPAGVYSIHLCMIGGGGGGAGNVSGNDFNNTNGGGYCGTVVEVDIATTPGAAFSVAIGAGGSGAAKASGQPGGATTFTGYSAAGGAGGVQGSASYGGNGGSKAVCAGTFTHGSLHYDAGFNNNYYGGEAGFGNGASGYGVGSEAGYGAGGGGGTGSTNPKFTGGSGKAIVSWG